MKEVAPQRILLLSSSTGTGHDRRAATFQRWLERLQAVPNRMSTVALLEDSSTFLKAGVDAYNWIQRRAPWAHNVYWLGVEAFGVLQGHRLEVGRAYWDQLLERERPDVLVSFHDSTNRGYFDRARAIVPDVRCATYCGEWTGGLGFSRLWVSRAVDVFVGRTQATMEAARPFGLPETSQRLVLTDFLNPEEGSTVDRENEPPRVLLMSSGLGAGSHRPFLEALRELGSRISVTAVCGKSPELYADTQAWCEAHADFSLEVESDSKQIERWMYRSTFVITRGGSNTAAEALAHGCIPLFHTQGGQMPQESPTIRYFEGKAIGLKTPGPNHVVTAIHRLLDDRDALHGYQQRLATEQPMGDRADRFREFFTALGIPTRSDGDG